MEPQKFTRTNIETIEGVLLTEDNMVEAAKFFADMEAVIRVALELKNGGISINVTTRTDHESFCPGHFVDVSGKRPRRAYERRTVGEWVPA